MRFVCVIFKVCIEYLYFWLNPRHTHTSNSTNRKYVHGTYTNLKQFVCCGFFFLDVFDVNLYVLFMGLLFYFRLFGISPDFFRTIFINLVFFVLFHSSKLVRSLRKSNFLTLNSVANKVVFKLYYSHHSCRMQCNFVFTPVGKLLVRSCCCRRFFFSREWWCGTAVFAVYTQWTHFKLKLFGLLIK